jgi:hypothetical protein
VYSIVKTMAMSRPLGAMGGSGRWPGPTAIAGAAEGKLRCTKCEGRSAIDLRISRDAQIKERGVTCSCSGGRPPVRIRATLAVI